MLVSAGVAIFLVVGLLSCYVFCLLCVLAAWLAGVHYLAIHIVEGESPRVLIARRGCRFSQDQPQMGSAKRRGGTFGISREPREVVAFYSVMAIAMLIGIGINFTPTKPTLCWSAVINRVAAVSIVILLMVMTARRMSEFTISEGVKTFGWAATIVMLGSVIGMAVTAFV